MIDVVMFSSGKGSWAAAHRVREQREAAGRGLDGLVLLFADVRGEDADNYRFLRDAAADVGGQLVTVQDGRTIWDVFRDRKFLGNTRVANCSLELKQRPARTWLEQYCDPASTTVHVGIDALESHRLAGVRRGYAHSLENPCRPLRSGQPSPCRSLWDPTTGDRLEGPGCTTLLPDHLQWQVEAPLCSPPYVDGEQVLADMKVRGLEPPRLYAQGFAHANCSGGCVKAGAGQFVHLLRTRPDVFAEWEAQEQQLRKDLGKPVAILRDRRGKRTRPMTLAQLRDREARRPEQLDLFDLGGCGCFVDGET